MADILSLFAGRASSTVATDRAIADLRAGRPVAVVDGSALLVMPAETFEPDSVAALETLAAGQARLVLGGPRLHRLGADTRQPGSIALPRMDAARVEALSVARDARLDAPVHALSALESAGLELVRLAALLPAYIAVPLAEGPADPALLRVGAGEINAYRGVRAADIRIVSRAPMPLEDAPDSEIVIFRGGEGLRDQAAVIVGRPDPAAPVLVRMHSACLTGDLFGSLKCDCGDQLRMTARAMARSEGGIILYLDQEGRGNGLSNKIKAYRLQAEGLDTYDADEVLGFDRDQRRFDFAAAMLAQLGVKRVRLMTNNPLKIAALEAAGLEMVSSERIHGRLTKENVGYLAAKRDRAGHRIDASLVAPPARTVE